MIQNERDADQAGLGEPGLWYRLFGRDLREHEAGAYGRSVVQGHAVVSVRVPEEEAPKVVELLDSYKPVDSPEKARGDPSRVKQPPTVFVPPATSAAVPRPDEEVVRLAEEELSVDKRRFEEGITRVRRFTIEKPVEAAVTLHEEHVEVIRRASSDPTFLKDIDWSEQMFEIREVAERPVVEKHIRLSEEVVIRKNASDHVETVHDTVRKQQLDVERVPAGPVKKSA